MNQQQAQPPPPSQQQQQQQPPQAPSTPQRIFTGSALNPAARQTLTNQNQNPFNNRSYSPQTPLQNPQVQQVQQQQQLIRTPIQLMQQQTQNLANSPIVSSSSSASSIAASASAAAAAGAGASAGGGNVNSSNQPSTPSTNSAAAAAAAAAVGASSNLTDSSRKRHAGSSSLLGSNQPTTPFPSASSSSSVANNPSTLQSQQLEALSRTQNKTIRKKGKLKDKIIPQKIRELVPDSQSYMDLLAFERKLDATIMRKRLDIQEALKRPMKIKKKLRVFITNQYYPGKIDADNDEDCVPQWELKIEGRLLDDNKSDLGSASSTSLNSLGGVKAKPRKFSSFFKSLVIELDKDLYGPDNHLVEWHRTAQTAETDGFQVKRHGDQSLKCTILMLLDYQPPQFKLDPRLAKILSIHTATRPFIIQSLWQYIKLHKLQDNQEKEFINLDKYLQQIFECERIKFSEIPNKLHMHCSPPDPIVINHMINIETNEPKRTSIYDIDVEVDDSLRDQMKNFLSASQTQSLAEIAQLDAKINEQIELINQLRINRDFLMSFSEDPQDFINKWLISQSNDLKTMLDLNGNPEEERKAQFYHEPWTDEAVSRYFYNKVQQRRAELEQVLGIRS